jgi:hypothetical protein
MSVAQFLPVKGAISEVDLFILRGKTPFFSKGTHYTVSRPQIYYSQGFWWVLELRRKRAEIFLRYS